MRLQISFQTFKVLTLRYVKWFNFHRAVSAYRIKEANPALCFGLPVLIFSVIIALIRSSFIAMNIPLFKATRMLPLLLMCTLSFDGALAILRDLDFFNQLLVTPISGVFAIPNAQNDTIQFYKSLFEGWSLTLFCLGSNDSCNYFQVFLCSALIICEFVWYCD